MKQCECLVYDSSLRFSKAVFGILVLIAFLIQNFWLVLAVSLLMIVGAFSIKLNILYQLHVILFRKILKKKMQPIQKDPIELSFACGMGGSVLLFSFLLFHFGGFVGFAWIMILIMAFMMLLAGFVGVCIASIIQVLLKKIFKK